MKFITICCFHLIYGIALSQIPQERLVLHLPFNDSSTRDISIYEHEVNNQGTNFVTGINGTGIALNGVDNYVQVEHATQLEISEQVTVSLWYKHQQQAADKFYSLLEQSADEFEGHSRYGIWLKGNNQLWACIEPDQCTGGATLCQRCISQNSTLTEETWYHIVSVYKGQTLQLYLNGALFAEKTFATASGISVRKYPLRIGTDLFDPSPVYLRGTLDEIKIYDVALNANEIQQLYDEFSVNSITATKYIDLLEVYPQPASDLLHIMVPEKQAKVTIYDLHGKLITQLYSENRHIDVSFLNNGVYILKIVIANTILTNRIAILKS